MHALSHLFLPDLVDSGSWNSSQTNKRLSRSISIQAANIPPFSEVGSAALRFSALSEAPLCPPAFMEPGRRAGRSGFRAPLPSVSSANVPDDVDADHFLMRGKQKSRK